MKITVLTENTSNCGLPYEHGLSLYIESGKHKILFDTGQSELFSKNAEALGIDLGGVDIAVLSHGHYDHGGGLAKFLELNKTAPVYLHRRAFEPHFNGERYIGLDISLKENSRFVSAAGETKITDGLTLYDCNDREKLLDLGSFGLNMEQNGKLVPDDFRHEHYLMIEENGKRILISGCSHKGIVNIAEWFKPDVLVGGFHFNKLPLDGNLKGYAERLDSLNTAFYTCHCTGVEQYAFMKRYMKNLHYIATGDVIKI